jgi:protein TonB
LTVDGRGVALVACLTGSVALHIGLLLSNLSGTAVPSGTRPSHASSVRVRVDAAGARPSTDSRITAAPTIQPRFAVSPDGLPARATHVAVVEAAESNEALMPDPERLPPTGAGPVPSADPVTDPDLAYLPRSLLTRPPAPQQSIDLLYPELAPSGRFRAVVTLFIDDRGVVQRVRIDEADDSGLPPVLEDATRQTFLRSAFAPGEIDGRPTRSRLRIEVEYATELRREATPP